MNKKLYLKQHLPILFVNLLCMTGISLFLFTSGNNSTSVLLILSIWILIIIIYFEITFSIRKKQFDQLLKLAEQLQECYLLPEVMEKPERADDQIFYQLLKMSEKSMIERIDAIEQSRKDYKEYIEQWIHEIKIPLTAIQLLCENNHTDFTRNLLIELEKVNGYTNQALYYARSEHTEKDYFVQEISLLDLIHLAISDNKYLLRQNNIKIELEEINIMVYSDAKWVRFILNQLITNAVKYRTVEPILKFFFIRQDDHVVLCVQDNGIGIIESDLPRIFEKGFTGENGRNTAPNATGMGLYLCKKMCNKLGIGITVESRTGLTIFQLSFQINDFINQVQNER